MERGGEEEGEKKETGAIWAIAVEVLGGKNKGKRKIGCGGFCGRGERGEVEREQGMITRKK